jgi:hypothetical protein
MKKLLTNIVFLLMSLLPVSACASGGVSVFAEALEWLPSEQSSSILTSDISLALPANVIFAPKNISFKMSTGFRGGIRYEPEGRFFDTAFFWTYLPSNTSTTFAAASQIVAPEFFSGFASGNFFFGSHFNWNLVMNMFDLQASHAFAVGKSFTLRPALGVKGGTINQTINATWNAVIYTSTEKLTNNFSGLGPTLGLEGKWNFYDGFNLVGSFGTAFLWGNWNVRDTYTRPSALLGLITPTTIDTKMNNANLGTLMLDYFVGLEYAHAVRHTNLAVKLGFEGQYWANQLRLTTFQQLPLHGDLTFQGVTCGLRLEL